MNKLEQHRLIKLRRQVSIAKEALARIGYGGRDPEGCALNALEEIARHEPDKRPLQNLVGHGVKAR